MLPALALKFIKSKLQLVYLFPLVISLTAFIIGFLCTLAGQNAGVLEDLAVLRVNTSQLGYFLVSSLSNSSDSGGSDDGDSLFDSLRNAASDLKNDVKDELTDITSDIADKLAGELGIAQWYSLHLTSACQGNFSDASKAGSSVKTTSCTESKINFKFNLTDNLSKELSVGPLNISLSDLGFTNNFAHGVTRQLNHLTTFLFVIFVLFLVGSITSGITCGLSLACVLVAKPQLLRFATIASGISFFCLLIGTVVGTLVAGQIAQTLTDFGDVIGLEATAGTLWMQLMVSVVFMMGAVFGLFYIKYRTPEIKAAAGRAKERVKNTVRRGDKGKEGKEGLEFEFV